MRRSGNVDENLGTLTRSIMIQTDNWDDSVRRWTKLVFRSTIVLIVGAEILGRASPAEL